MFSEEEWLDEILAVKLLDPSQLFAQYALVKSDVWAYEKEWRVWTLELQRQPKLFSDYLLLQEEVEAVYMGCKIDSEQKKVIMTLLSDKYPRAQVFQARKSEDEYKLYFDPL